MTFQKQLIELNQSSEGVCLWVLLPSNGKWLCKSTDVTTGQWLGESYSGTTESEAVYAAYSDQM